MFEIYFGKANHLRSTKMLLSLVLTFWLSHLAIAFGPIPERCLSCTSSTIEKAGKNSTNTSLFFSCVTPPLFLESRCEKRMYRGLGWWDGSTMRTVSRQCRERASARVWRERESFFFLCV